MTDDVPVLAYEHVEFRSALPDVFDVLVDTFALERTPRLAFLNDKWAECVSLAEKHGYRVTRMANPESFGYIYRFDRRTPSITNCELFPFHHPGERPGPVVSLVSPASGLLGGPPP